MNRLIFSLVAFLLLTGCRQGKFDSTGIAARVGDHVLTIEDVARNVPPGLDAADSARMARNYVNNWAEEQAVILMAEKFIPDTKEIEKMVEDYRRQLLMWEYRRQMTLQNGKETPAEEDINEYYSNHKSVLKLQRPIIKGIYIKLPEDAKEVAEIRKLYRSEKTTDMDKLEKLVDHAVNYEYFRDRWVDWSNIELRIPAKELDADPDNYPATHDHLEVKSDGYVYFLAISDHKKPGEIMPIDYARAYIVEALERENAVTYDKSLRKQLLDKAYREGIAEIFID